MGNILKGESIQKLYIILNTLKPAGASEEKLFH